MDCFYAAVEMRDNPEYRDIPLAVGGDGPRSVLCTCNYLAREYGVRSAMPATKAKKLCPDLIIVNGRMGVYKQVSAHIREIFSRYTDLIEPLSLDEAFLDVTECQAQQGSATLIAQEIRQAIYDELQLTASAGVAPNKFLAKIASDENKPNGQFVISPDKVPAFVEHLPLRKIPGVGPKTSEKLAARGFHSCADIRASNVESLVPIMGKFGQNVFNYSFGQDNRAVINSRIRKSVAVERTFAIDLTKDDQCEDTVRTLFDKLLQRYQPYQERTMAKQGVKIKFADFTQTTVEHQSKSPELDGYFELLKIAISRGQGKSIRLIGLSIGFADQAQHGSKTTSTLQLELPM